MELLSRYVFGNPHSTNPASQAMTHLMDRARRSVLSYFHASPQEYAVIFTPNATGALKLAGGSYPFAPGGHYLLTFDNRNSVNGFREFAHAKGAAITYVPLEPLDLRVNESYLHHLLAQAHPGRPNLFAYPAQSNVTGVQHPLDWILACNSRAGMSSSIVRHLSPPTAWISHDGIPILFPSPSLKCSATQREWDVYWLASPR